MSKRLDLSEPVFLLTSSYLLSSIFVILNYDNWNVKEFNCKTYVLIALCILLWILGDSLGKFIYRFLPKKNIISHSNLSENNSFNIDFKSTIISTLVVIISIFFYFFSLIKRSGFSFSNFIEFMNEIRPLLKENKISISFLMTQSLCLSRGIAYVFSFVFLWNFIKLKKKQISYLTVPTIYLVMSLLTSGRVYIIYYIIYVFVLFFLIASINKKFSIKNISFIAMRVILIVIFTLSIFALLANIVGRNTEHTIFEQLSVYIGGPIPAFDIFITNNKFNNPNYFGEETLIGVYQILRKIGFTEIELNRHLEYVNFGNNWGNVYTAQRRYIHDYGLVNSYLIIGCISIIYSFSHEFIKKRNSKILYIIYAMLFYPVPMFVIDDVFLSSLLSINTLYDVFYILLVYSIICKRGFKNC